MSDRIRLRESAPTPAGTPAPGADYSVAPRRPAPAVPGHDTPVGVEVCVPSRRGRDAGPDVQHSQNVPSSVQGPARFGQIASAMHGKRASAIDTREARAEAQRATRLQRRREKRGA